MGSNNLFLQICGSIGIVLTAINLLPMLVIVSYRMWMFARERFVLVTLFYALGISCYMIVESFPTASTGALVQASNTNSLSWCIFLATGQFFINGFILELTCILSYTFYSINTLSNFPIKFEVFMHTASAVIALSMAIVSGWWCSNHCKTEHPGSCLYPILTATKHARIRTAQTELIECKALSRTEKSRHEQLLTMYKATIKSVYSPLKFYPLLFLSVLISDVVMLSLLPPAGLHDDEAVGHFHKRTPIIHLLWIVGVGSGSFVLFFSQKEHRERLNVRRLLQRCYGKRVRVAKRHNYIVYENPDDSEDDEADAGMGAVATTQLAMSGPDATHESRQRLISSAVPPDMLLDDEDYEDASGLAAKVLRAQDTIKRKSRDGSYQPPTLGSSSSQESDHDYENTPINDDENAPVHDYENAVGSDYENAAPAVSTQVTDRDDAPTNA
ncbi:uncharacterized protein MONBRDRAFT_28466 [Monosiga brevicollis MX1]|uniref:Uncharacterized protein n=1 Tax=Monosiga brevicollis TaxID=81824 RepID=A9V891_MONBE|nr:uncharacterized protein MONBRDRAFT_28466 [Monosiga brevicollis MX1]EDQ86229.1 predicted protein [Monosiga brevicollis MX1]|eukprot:XP_001748899.1 hypothetical protein [Monosiga brevicollis MX1]